jgi:hypothetical protein
MELVAFFLRLSLYLRLYSVESLEDVMNNAPLIIWKETAVTWFQLLSQYLAGRTNERHEMLIQSGRYSYECLKVIS